MSSRETEPGGEAGVRLNRHLAHCGVCSRRDADVFIAAGRVAVNGSVVREMGVRVRPGDRVSVDGRPVGEERKVWLLLNKPADCITTVEDTHGRRTVLDVVRGACAERIYPVGRLDRETTGLLLLTNDGDLARELAHPSTNLRKVYEAVLDRPIRAEEVERLRRGLELEDGFMQVDAAEVIGRDARRVRVTLHSGRNRIVRRLFQHLGMTVVELDRTRFAGLGLGGLARGKWRLLERAEVESLAKAAGGG